MTPSKQYIIDLLIKRDQITAQEAEDWYDETAEALKASLSDDEGWGDTPEDILLDEMGLEPDYLDYFPS